MKSNWFEASSLLFTEVPIPSSMNGKLCDFRGIMTTNVQKESHEWILADEFRFWLIMFEHFVDTSEDLFFSGECTIGTKTPRYLVGYVSKMIQCDYWLWVEERRETSCTEYKIVFSIKYSGS